MLISRKEIDPQTECHKCQHYPDKAALAQCDEEERQSQIECREKEETIETHSILQTLQVCSQSLTAQRTEAQLHLVSKLLLWSQRAMRRHWRLKRKRGRYTILL